MTNSKPKDGAKLDASEPYGIKLYGIKNCDTVKKARQWLEQQGIEYQFHDLRVDGLNAARIEIWRQQVDWVTLLNKRSTTWKQLDETTKASVNSNTVSDVLLENPTLIKRPVLEHSGKVHIGFKAAEYTAIFIKHC